MRNHLVIAASALLLGSATAAAASKPPWDVPKSDWGGAEPLNGPWFTFEDYPTESVRDDEEGYVTVAFTIGIDGKVTDCRLVRSSGYRRLDVIPYNIMTRRARFKPAVDAEGRSRPAHGTTSMLFWMPEQ
jgi:periplasmic protein TonB